MSTIRIRKKVESETLSLPELRDLIGKMIQITVEVEDSQAVENPWAETDRLREKNAKLYPGPDIGVDIIREMRDSRHLEHDA